MMRIVAVGLVLVSGLLASGAERPNIVLVMADDLGYEALGCDGGLDVATPRLDALAGD